MKNLLLPILLAAGSLVALAQEPKPAAAAPATAASAGDCVELTLGVIPNTMKYDKTELTVPAGKKVKLLFKNEKCALMHNFLLIKPGTLNAVGALAGGFVGVLRYCFGIKKAVVTAKRKLFVELEG